MPVERKYPTVGEAVSGAPPLQPEEARRRRRQAYGSWEKYFEEDPTFADAFRRDCGCGPTPRSDDEATTGACDT